MPTVTLRTAVSSFSRAPRVRARPGHRPGYGGRMVERSEPTFRGMRRRITATKRGHISSNREKKLGCNERQLTALYLYPISDIYIVSSTCLSGSPLSIFARTHAGRRF